MSLSDRHAELADFSLSQAIQYNSRQNHIRAFPHYLVFAQLEKQKFQDEHIPQFLNITHALVSKLEQGKEDKVEEVYKQAIEVLPSNPELLTNFGSFLFKQNQTERAEGYFRAALAADPKYLTAKDRLENLSTSLLERWHFPMLNDISRNRSFQSAISRHVRGGCSTVLDIGTGTGLLSLMAVKAGAERVYACEASEVMVVTAKDVLMHNVEGEKVRLIPKLSLDMDEKDVPEKVSLLITETFDSGLLGEHVLETMLHAWRKFLAPGCRVVPAWAEFYLVPVECGWVKRGVGGMLEKSVGYLECERVRVVADMIGEGDKEEPYMTEKLDSVRGGFKMLSRPQKLFSVSFECPEQIEELVEGKVFSKEFLATIDGDCDAIAGWFKLHLDEDQEISTEPGSPSCWEQVVFPIRSKKRKVYKNSKVEVELFVKKHIVMQRVEITHNIEGNGVNGTKAQMIMDKQVTLPFDMVKLLNCKLWTEASQWVSYSLVRDMPCSTVLDMTFHPPAIAMQVLKLKPDSKLTLFVNTSDSRGSKQVLDWVTTVSSCNHMNLTSIDCITKLTPESKYNCVFISPVTQTGRLNTSCMLEIEKVSRNSTTPLMRAPSIILPFRLELWAVVISSKELAQRSHLVSNDPVLDFTIADQMNILAVAHQQEINYMGLEKVELSIPTMVTSLEMANISLERKELVNSLTLSRSGVANGLAYWFMMDYGWNIKLSTLESEAYNQAVFLCKEVTVEEGDRLLVRCQMEGGIIDFQFDGKSSGREENVNS